MDNHLTPNKIQRLIHFAADKSFNMPRRLLINDEDLKRLATINQAAINKSNMTANCESSSGILDLDRMEGFGESGIRELSLSKSTNFNPGEMTGRSTGTEDIAVPLGRHSLALENITSQMDKQTSEIQDIMRHSIATNFSFHSKRDLTADEISLVDRDAPLPVQNNPQAHFTESMSMNYSNLSVGAYFKNRCSDPGFVRVFSKTESPDRSCMPSITEVSASYSGTREPLQSDTYPVHKIDQTLDCVPVRQPRNNIEDFQGNPNNINQVYAPQTSIVIPKIQNEASNSKVPCNTEEFYMSQVPNKPMYVQMTMDTVSPQKSSSIPLNKDTNLLIKNLQASLRITGEDTEGSVENSLSISKIADYLGKQSNVSVTDMLQYNNKKKHLNKKQPLTELHMNIPESKKKNKDIEVMNLKDTRKAETASSSGTVNTVISLAKYKTNNEQMPTVVETEHSIKDDQIDIEDTKRTTRSKSPSTKSHSTLSTVQENYISFKSGDSPLYTSKGEANTSHVRSPNVVYKELDKSVDWHEVMQQKHLKQDSLAKEQWVEISAPAANGYVGACCPVTLTVTTLTDSWLTAKLQFVDLPDEGSDLTIELPRMPLLLSPGKSEKITLYITANVEFNTRLNYVMCLKDASIDGDIKQRGNVEVDIKVPVIQAMSCDGVNKISFPATQAETILTKSFVLISSCPVDLQLVLSIVQGESVFNIKSVQEIKKSDVNKVLTDRQGSTEDGQPPGKAKSKTINKQICRLTAGNAIRVTIKFNAPKIFIQKGESLITCTGILNVNLFSVNNILRKVDLIGVVGIADLVIKTTANKLQLSHDPINIDFCNNGSIPGTWIVKFKTNSPNDNFPFKISPSKLEIPAGTSQIVSMLYTGPTDTVCDATLIFEDIASGHKTTIEISGGSDKPKIFPIKTNYNIMSWVRPGRKELSLKNATNKKIYMRCQIVGDGFAIDLPRESRGIYCVTFGPCECRPLPIIFAPISNTPHKATLHLVHDKGSDYARKICLYGCSSGESMRWSGLVTYGDTALVRAVSRMPINLELYNKSHTAAFVSARVNFNLQYMWLSGGAELEGGSSVVRARSRHALSLRVPWAALERRARAAPAAPPACALATLSVLTGAEFTRRRILKILRDESNGRLDTALLPDHLKMLADKFEGEDNSMDELIADFKETEASLNELIGGLQELTAQIDLPQDFADENTILIDDTVLEHHTLCDQ